MKTLLAILFAVALLLAAPLASHSQACGPIVSTFYDQSGNFIGTDNCGNSVLLAAAQPTYASYASYAQPAFAPQFANYGFTSFAYSPFAFNSFGTFGRFGSRVIVNPGGAVVVNARGVNIAVNNGSRVVERRGLFGGEVIRVHR